MLAKLFGKKKRDDGDSSISAPMEVVHAVHLDKDMNWTFDESVDPKTIFTKLKVIGKGGFGTVSQIVHRPSMKILAGKLVNPSLIEEEHSRDEIQHEIDLMREVDSPFTVRYYGCVKFEGSLMILMEYVDRGSLRDILDSKEQVLSEDQIACVMHDLLHGLKLIHNTFRIMHRDIKAANLLLNSKGMVKLADFGVSRQFDNGSSCSTMTIVGTPYWMAPEVISGLPYSYPADIWSVGITAVELAEGAPPYVEYSPTKAMVDIATQGFPGYRFPQMHSPEFQDFVSHCVQSNPEKRWTVDQLIEHPFIKRASSYNRIKVMQDLIKEGAKNLGVSSESFSVSQASFADGSSKAFQSSSDSFAASALKSGTSFDMNFDSYADYAHAYLDYQKQFQDSYDEQNSGLMSVQSSFQFENSSSFESRPSFLEGSFMDDYEFSRNPFADNGLMSFKLPNQPNSILQNSNSDFQAKLQQQQQQQFFNDLPIVKAQPPPDLQNLSAPQIVPAQPYVPPQPLEEKPPEQPPRMTVKFDLSNAQEKKTLKLEQKEDNVFVLSLDNQKRSRSPREEKQPKLDDRAFQQVSRIMSKKIPFSPLTIAANPDAPIETIYSTVDPKLMMRKKLLPPLFDEDGVINFDAAIRHDNATKFCAIAMVLFALTFFGSDGFFLLLGISILTHISVIFMLKRKQRHEEIVKRAKEIRSERNKRKIAEAQQRMKMKRSLAQ